MRSLIFYFLLLASIFAFAHSFQMDPNLNPHRYSRGNAPSNHHWPHLVGKDGNYAKEFILQNRPDMKVEILPEGAMVTMDMREDRVRIFVNEKGSVVRPPRVG